MTTPKDHRPVVSGDDWMRGLEKRIGHEERRQKINKAADLLGPGLAPYAVLITDWNSATARFNGLWYSEDADNAPTSTGTYVGMTIAAREGHGTQIATSHDSTPMKVYVRAVHTHPAQAPSYSAWEQIAPASTPSAAMPTGAMIGWPVGATIPTGWLIANGDPQPATTYPALAALLGDTTGEFTLPNVPTANGMRTIIKT